MEKKNVSKKENKYKKVISTITNMNLGETISPTRLFKEANINPNDTGRDLLDLHDSLKEIGFVILRDKNEKIKAILRTNENLDIKRELRDQRREIIGMRDSPDELKTILKRK